MTFAFVNYVYIQGLSNKECMLCVLTAFEILSGQGVCEWIYCRLTIAPGMCTVCCT